MSEYCDNCGRLKTEFKVASTHGPFCWWCRDRAAGSVSSDGATKSGNGGLS